MKPAALLLAPGCPLLMLRLRLTAWFRRSNVMLIAALHAVQATRAARLLLRSYSAGGIIAPCSAQGSCASHATGAAVGAPPIGAWRCGRPRRRYGRAAASGRWMKTRRENCSTLAAGNAMAAHGCESQHSGAVVRGSSGRRCAQRLHVREGIGLTERYNGSLQQ